MCCFPLRLQFLFILILARDQTSWYKSSLLGDDKKMTRLIAAAAAAGDETTKVARRQKTVPVEQKSSSRERISHRRRRKRTRQPETKADDISITNANNNKGQRAKNGTSKQRHYCSNRFNFPNRFQMFFRNGQTKTAYCMAVLARLAYYPFHRQTSKKLLAEGIENNKNRLRGFRLMKRQRHNVFKFLQCHLRRGWTRLLHLIHRHCCRRRHSNNDHAKFCFRKWMNHNQRVTKETADKYQYTLHYSFYDWFEPTAIPGVNYHDTDLLVSTSHHGNILALTFAGTASAADHATNIQTFEKANHSALFHGGVALTNQQESSNTTTFSSSSSSSSSIQGSLHRGFLNAYSRVDRGHVVSLSSSSSSSSSILDKNARSLTLSLDRRFGHCILRSKRKGQDNNETLHNEMVLPTTIENPSNSTSMTEPFDKETIRVKRNGVCRVRRESLMTILRELITEALLNGKTVHLSGHSLGGGLATIAALDIVINFPDIPVSKLHLWTFGAPQVADDIFFQSAVNVVPRLRSFVEGNGRLHRFVTLSDSCEVDFVSTVTEKALPSHKPNLRGRAARHLGGLKGAAVHFGHPHYLLTSDQYDTDYSSSNRNWPIYKTKTDSAIDVHSMSNYLEGISREACEHPLSTDLPLGVREWMGEDTNAEVIS